MHLTSQSAQFMFRNALWRYQDKTALVVDGQSFTYRELDQRSNHLAACLLALGLTKGDRLAILLRNCMEYVVADLAILKLGAVKVALNEMLSTSDVTYMIDHSSAKALLVHSSLCDKLDKKELSRTHLTSIFELDDMGEGIDKDHKNGADFFCEENALETFDWVPVAPEDPAFILYTGGTTGRSKGVLHTHGAMMINGLTHVINAEISEAEKLLLVSPLPHAAGFMLQAGLLHGACVYIENSFDPGSVLNIVAREKITWTFMVPTMIYRVLDAFKPEQHDIASLRTLVYGAAPITRARLREVLAKFGPVLLQLFGQSEVPDFATRLSKADHLDERFMGSCGQPVITADVRIADEDGRELAFGEVGEIIVRSPYTLACYYNDPEKTEEVYAGEWLKTGDVGYQVESGHVFIVDRSKDMIISGGMNVYSTEVENIVQEHPDVSQVMVIGVPHEDWGEAVCAAVIPTSESFDQADLITFCKQRLAAYKVPKVIEIVDDIPLTAYGKPDKKSLRAKYWGEQARQVN